MYYWVFDNLNSAVMAIRILRWAGITETIKEMLWERYAVEAHDLTSEQGSSMFDNVTKRIVNENEWQ